MSSAVREEKISVSVEERVKKKKKMDGRGSKVQQCVHLNVTVMLSSTLM